jgi:hypothetical protein
MNAKHQRGREGRFLSPTPMVVRISQAQRLCLDLLSEGPLNDAVALVLLGKSRKRTLASLSLMGCAQYYPTPDHWKITSPGRRVNERYWHCGRCNQYEAKGVRCRCGQSACISCGANVHLNGAACCALCACQRCGFSSGRHDGISRCAECEAKAYWDGQHNMDPS